MASLNVSMTPELRKFVDQRTKSTSHSTPTEYIRTLIREDQKRAQREQLDRLLLEGLESGEPIDATSEQYWLKKKAMLQKRLQSNRKKAG